MYEHHFGLRERPFELTPDPRYLVLTRAHEEALANLEYGITARKGVILLLGEAGTGKTTLLRKALATRLGQGDTSSDGWVALNNPVLSRREFFEVLATGFGLSAAARSSKGQFVLELHRLLTERQRDGLVTALIVDEAQALPYPLLEELRLLANIEASTQALLSLVLAGQPELADRLNDPALRQFKQRIALRCRLQPLTLPETASYVAARLRLAGGDPAAIFTRDAIVAVHEASRGIPRTISVVCDNSLLAGFAGDLRPVDAPTVWEVCEDFDLHPRDAAGPRQVPAGRVPASPRAPRPPVFGAARRS